MHTREGCECKGHPFECYDHPENCPCNDKDARIAELEKALREIDAYLDDAPTVRAIVKRVL